MLLDKQERTCAPCAKKRRLAEAESCWQVATAFGAFVQTQTRRLPARAEQEQPARAPGWAAEADADGPPAGAGRRIACDVSAYTGRPGAWTFPLSPSQDANSRRNRRGRTELATISPVASSEQHQLAARTAAHREKIRIPETSAGSLEFIQNYFSVNILA